jgi:hypothetical protein
MSPRAKVRAGGIIRTSLDNTWRTPESILERVRVLLGDPIPFDAATGPENPAKAARFCAGAPGTLFAPKPEAELTAHEVLARTNGLEQPWDWPTWLNPPYGSELRDWLRKIELEAARGTTIVTLLPCGRWETDYFQRFLGLAPLVCLHRKRVAFVSSIDGKAVGANPGASMLLGFNVRERESFRVAFSPLGACFQLRVLRDRTGCPRQFDGRLLEDA